MLRLIHGRYTVVVTNYPGGEENLGIEHEGRTEKARMHGRSDCFNEDGKLARLLWWVRTGVGGPLRRGRAEAVTRCSIDIR